MNGGIGAGFHQVWVGDGLEAVYAVSPATRRFLKVPGVVPGHAIAIGGTGAVYTSDAGSVAAINPVSRRSIVDQSIVTAGSSGVSLATIGIAATPDALWGVSAASGSVYRMNLNTLIPDRTRLLAPGLHSVTVANRIGLGH